MNKLLSIVALAFAFAWSANAFGVPLRRAALGAATTMSTRPNTFSSLRMTDENESTAATTTESSDVDPMQEEEMDAATKLQLEKQRRADELRAQEVFMKKSTGIHKCTNCDWEYDETKGDSMMIGGQIKPGTVFDELPSNWRCPVCRASKDSFAEVEEIIPGFEVNQGYGLGGNSLTSGQKSGLIFGGLGFFFLLFLSGYAMS